MVGGNGYEPDSKRQVVLSDCQGVRRCSPQTPSKVSCCFCLELTPNNITM